MYMLQYIECEHVYMYTYVYTYAVPSDKLKNIFNL